MKDFKVMLTPEESILFQDKLHRQGVVSFTEGRPTPCKYIFVLNGVMFTSNVDSLYSQSVLPELESLDEAFQPSSHKFPLTVSVKGEVIGVAMNYAAVLTAVEASQGGKAEWSIKESTVLVDSSPLNLELTPVTIYW